MKLLNSAVAPRANTDARRLCRQGRQQYHSRLFRNFIGISLRLKLSGTTSFRLLIEHVKQLEARGYDRQQIRGQLTILGIPGSTAEAVARALEPVVPASARDQQPRPAR